MGGRNDFLPALAKAGDYPLSDIVGASPDKRLKIGVAQDRRGFGEGSGVGLRWVVQVPALVNIPSFASRLIPDREPGGDIEERRVTHPNERVFSEPWD